MLCSVAVCVLQFMLTTLKRGCGYAKYNELLWLFQSNDLAGLSFAAVARHSPIMRIADCCTDEE